MKISRNLLIRFSRNECTPEEEQAIQEWLNDGSWPRLPDGIEVPGDMKQVIWKKINSGRYLAAPELKRAKKTYLKIAAALAVLIATACFVYLFNGRNPDSQLVYVTKANEHKQVLLPDSSVVYLAPNSSLALEEEYNNNRELHLKGKAEFEVKADEDHPFTVISGKIKTTALGTSFRVRSYPGKNRINVLLSYGKVVVENFDNKSKAVYLEPGEEVIYDKEMATLKKVQAGAGQFNYKQHVLYFRNAGLKEVVEKLERFYQVKVETRHLEDVNWLVSGEFKYQPLDVVMKAIAFSCNINYEIKGKKIILKQKENEQ